MSSAARADAPRSVVVTGASRGIGHAIASTLRDVGWQVFNLDIEAPPADQLNSPATWIETDLASPAAIDTACARVREHGPVTGLVNNAAIGTASLLEDTTAEQLDRAFAINLRAPSLCASALVADMKSAGFGRIVNISSRAHLGKTHRTAYAGTKGGVLSMARVWALELAAHGITCNTIAPGPVQTALFDQVNPPGMARTQTIIDAIPVGRLGQPEDIANAVAFFMDERAAFVTGQVLYVCGGVTLARGGS